MAGPQTNGRSERKSMMLAVGGGKGGVGKTMLAANLGVGLAQNGADVILVDADLGGANLHSYVGIRSPDRTIADFFRREVDSLEDLLLETRLPTLRLVAGTNEVLGVANPRHFAKLKLVRHINRLSADYVILDVGAGTSYNTIDLFALADIGVVVTLPEKPAIESAYGFVKSVLYRKLTTHFQKNIVIKNIIERGRMPDNSLDVHSVDDLIELIGREGDAVREESEELLRQTVIKIVVNSVQSDDEGDLGEAIEQLMRRYLLAEVSYVGQVPYSEVIRSSLVEMEPLLLAAPDDSASLAVSEIIRKLVPESSRDSATADAGERLVSVEVD